MKSEIGRFPAFPRRETIPGLTWPTLTFRGELAIVLGKLEVRISQRARHTLRHDRVGTSQRCSSQATCRVRSGYLQRATPILRNA